MAVSLSAANDHASLPIAYRLYLPHEWIDDPDRRAAAGIPDDIVFQTKPQIALKQLRAAHAAGIGYLLNPPHDGPYPAGWKSG